jgi:hypothetical protein
MVTKALLDLSDFSTSCTGLCEWGPGPEGLDVVEFAEVCGLVSDKL